MHFNLKNATDTNLYSLLARALQEKIDTIIKDFDIFYGVENFTQCDKSKKNANDLHRIVGTYNPKLINTLSFFIAVETLTRWNNCKRIII